MRRDSSTFARTEQSSNARAKAFSGTLAYNHATDSDRKPTLAMRLDQHQRDAILQEMGIQTYVPRQALPGARMSLPVVARHPATRTVRPPAPAAAPASSPAMTPLSAAVSPSVSPQKSAPIAIPQIDVAPTRTAAQLQPPAAVPAAVATAPVDAARFAFAYIPVNEHLAVINELPWARSASLSPSCRQLLADMLKALGVPCEASQLSPMVFTWPLSEAGDMPTDSESARHMLEGFLTKRLKLRPVRYLMVLAEQSAEFLFPAQSDWQSNADALFRHTRLPVELVVTHSLNAMEAVRELKRPAWQALQPLKHALASNRLAGGEPQA
jgi:hypothetical protein